LKISGILLKVDELGRVVLLLN